MGEQRNDKTKEKEEAADQEQPANQPQPPVAGSNPPSTEVLTSDEERRQRQEQLLARQVDAAECLNWITFIGAAVGLLGLVLIYGSLTVTQQTAEAAKKSADATIVGVRAWIVPIKAFPPALDALHRGVAFPLSFKNAGKTPAMELSLTQEFSYWDIKALWDAKNIGDACPPDTKTPYNYAALIADESQIYAPKPPGFDLDLTPAQTVNLKQQKAVIVVNACMRYKTIFKDDVPVTHWCFVAYAYDDSTVPLPCPSRSLELK